MYIYSNEKSCYSCKSCHSGYSFFISCFIRRVFISKIITSITQHKLYCSFCLWISPLEATVLLPQSTTTIGFFFVRVWRNFSSIDDLVFLEVLDFSHFDLLYLPNYIDQTVQNIWNAWSRAHKPQWHLVEINTFCNATMPSSDQTNSQPSPKNL